MSTADNSLAGLLLLNDRNLSPAEASDVLNRAPVVRALYAQAASQGGTQHKFVREATAPGAGFRQIGYGINNAAGTFDVITVSCALLDASFSRDKALALGYKNGPTAYMDREGMKALQEAFFQAEKAIFVPNAIHSFDSLIGTQFYGETTDGQVVNAGGSGGKSVWLLRSAEDGISMVAGNDGRMDMATEDTTVVLSDNASARYTALHRSIMAWLGLQVGSKYDAVRIVNLDATSTHTLTDALIGKAMSKFPAGRVPNMIAMGRVALAELQESRTAVNPTGAPAPFPTEAFGIPIITTDSLPINESPVATSSTTTTTNTTTTYLGA